MNEERQVADLARLAAFIDGEGCVGVYKRQLTSRGAIYRLQVQVSNTDPKLMLWLKQNFGGRVKPGKYRGPKCHIKYDWVVQGPWASHLLEQCMPYFVLKAEQALLAISFQSVERRKWGRKGMPEAHRRAFDFCSRRLHEMKMRNQLASEMVQ